MALEIGVDIGGTFTDLAMWETRTGRRWTEKLPTTPERPADAVVNGIEKLVMSSDVSAREIGRIFHATTLVTNAVIERKGRRTGLITTRGFRDLVSMGRESRFDLYDLTLRPTAPLVGREACAEVSERVLTDGTIQLEPQMDDVKRAVEELDPPSLEALAICFINSYRNPANEQLVKEMVNQLCPSVRVSCSADVCPEIGEFERASTTIINAYTQPLFQVYLEDLVGRLRAIGIGADLFLMLSSGGITTVERAKQYPVRLIESGPAAGVLSAAATSDEADKIVAFDMGGTAPKICLVRAGTALLTYEFEVARTHRFRAGSGLPVRAPALDLLEIGAGGGSIAHMDEYGLLKVGPHSAGAIPGPACYGRGGVQPTVTDAALVLGYLDPGRFLGGAMQLDKSLAVQALLKGVGTAASGGADAVAWGVFEVVNDNMARALQVHLAERGEDPRNYTLVATGGAGPLHAAMVAAKAQIPAVVCRPSTGVASALGLLYAPWRTDESCPVMKPLNESAWSEIRDIFNTLRDQAESTGRSQRSGTETVEYVLEMRFKGQGNVLRIPINDDELAHFPYSLAQRFRKTYVELFGHGFDLDADIEIVNCRLILEEKKEIEFHGLGVAADLPYTHRESRQAYFGRSLGRVDVKVFGRGAVEIGTWQAGPAVVEDPETTILIPPNWMFTKDQTGSVLLKLAGSRNDD